MRTVSWILLTVLSVLMIAVCIGSIAIAYFGSPSNDVIVGSTSLADLDLAPEVASALRGRRGTAASLGLGFSVFLFLASVGPYRKGDSWAWWAVLCSTAAMALASFLRIPGLGISQGATTSVLMLGVVVVALLLDIKRILR